jgi:leader peptidase (prepilin peptidase)/N-methyltransferase
MGGLFPDWTWIVGFFIGTYFGSFLNVVVYRMPRGLSLLKPVYSYCPKCRTQLGLSDLIPIFSWLSTKGRCRYCGQPIAARYMWVEIATGLVWAAVWYQYLEQGNDPARAIAYAAAATTLIAIIFIDWEFYIIPDQINAALYIIGIVYNIWLLFAGWPEAYVWGWPMAIVGSLVGVGVLWGIAFLGRLLFGKDAMGHGDIKMARGIGAVLGPIPAMISFALAVALGAVLGVIQVILLKRSESQANPAKAAATEASESLAPTGAEPVAAAEEEEEYEPETIGSLIKCGLGYVFLIDIVGLLFPKLYEKYFGESPFEPVEEWEDAPIERTMIPFGPYLALGAILTVVFQAQLLELVESYWRWVLPPEGILGTW